MLADCNAMNCDRPATHMLYMTMEPSEDMGIDEPIELDYAYCDKDIEFFASVFTDGKLYSDIRIEEIE